MKVIFLDFDGVLNCARYRFSVADYHSNFIDETRLKLLADFVKETGAEIVLTTQWRLHWNEGEKQNHPDGDIINALFAKYGLKICSKTEYLDNNRDLEVADWLVRHKVENYVIFDDVDCFWMELNRAHFVKTNDAKDGLTGYEIGIARFIFNKNKEEK